MKRYYAAYYHYGPEIGNKTSVLVFSDRPARDAWVARENAGSIYRHSAEQIPAKDATHHARNWDMTSNRMSGPRPFLGECWVIDPWITTTGGDIDPAFPGLLGVISTGSSTDSRATRLIQG